MRVSLSHDSSDFITLRTMSTTGPSAKALSGSSIFCSQDRNRDAEQLPGAKHRARAQASKMILRLLH